MKIAFFIRTLNNSGGTERITCALANQLARENHRVSVISWVGGVKSFFSLDKGVKIYSLFQEDNVNIYTTYLKTLFRYYKAKKDIAPDYIVDVCVAQSIVSIPINLFLKSKIISWEHFNTNVNWNMITGPLSRKLASAFGDKVVTLTTTDKKNYETKYKARNAFVIGNPITIENPMKSLLVNKKVLTVARFTYQKGLDLLLNSWQIVTKNFPEWRLQLVGDGELKKEIVALRDSLNLEKSVEILDATKEISKYYSEASIYAMSSRFEGMPLVLIEAKSYGLPIVCFDCETGPRDIVHDGFDGYLVTPFNINEFADSLMFLMKDNQLLRTFSKNTLLDLDRFSMSTFVNNWKQLLDI